MPPKSEKNENVAESFPTVSNRGMWNGSGDYRASVVGADGNCWMDSRRIGATMKTAALILILLVSLFVCFALVAFTAQKIADDAPAAIGSMVAQAQVAYQKGHDDAMKGK